jgi:predicted LPLAT superfamily acyltransferase
VPGVVLLDEVLHRLEVAGADPAPTAACRWHIRSVKFHRAVLPEQPLALEYTRDGSGAIRFELRSADSILVADGHLEQRAADAPHAPPPEVAPAASDWRHRRERGSQLLLLAMAFVSLRLGRRVSRSVLYLIAGYYFLFAPSARRPMQDYLRRALGRAPRARDRFRLIMSFATTSHDRLYLLAGRYQLFEVTVAGEDLIRAALARPGGAFLMGAHLGNFEVIRVVGQLRAGVNVTMAMYADNAHKANAMFAAVAAANPPEFIEVGHLDSMLRIQERLSRGALIGMLSDRRFGAEPSMPVTFLGGSARFPINPMRVAAMLRARVMFICGLYRGGNRYHVVFEPVADFSSTTAAERQSAIEAAVRRYVALLEGCCRTDPYNWYNFFDFWDP